MYHINGSTMSALFAKHIAEMTDAAAGLERIKQTASC